MYEIRIRIEQGVGAPGLTVASCMVSLQHSISYKVENTVVVLSIDSCLLSCSFMSLHLDMKEECA